MRIRNHQLGEVELADEAILDFPDGIVGFEGHHRFGLYKANEDWPFGWLISVDDPDLAFAVADPAQVTAEPYELTIGESELHRLDLKDSDPIEVFVIVSSDGRSGHLSVNLKGPIVLNLRSRLAKQLLLYSGRFVTQQPLVPLAGKGLSTESPKRGTVVRTVRRRAA